MDIKEKNLIRYMEKTFLKRIADLLLSFTAILGLLLTFLEVYKIKIDINLVLMILIATFLFYLS